MITRYGDQVDLATACKVLALSEAVRALVQAEIGDSGLSSALQMMSEGRLDGEIGEFVFDYLSETIRNESHRVWSGFIRKPHDDHPLEVRCYEGVYWVWAVEYEPVGYFLNEESAVLYARSNWDDVYEDGEAPDPNDEEEDDEIEPDWARAFEAVEEFLQENIKSNSSDADLHTAVRGAIELSDDMGAPGADPDVLLKMALELRSDLLRKSSPRS